MEQPDADPKSETRLLNEAVHHIANHGLEGLEIRALAEKAGTSTSQFVRHFGQKERLITAVFERGWSSIERSVGLSLLQPVSSLEDVVAAVLNGVLDALEEDTDAVSAALIIARSTFGNDVRLNIRNTTAHTRFFTLVHRLSDQFEKLLLSPDEAREVLELLYGAALHRLVLATPMCRSTSLKFDRQVFIRLMHRMVHGLLTNPASANADSA